MDKIKWCLNQKTGIELVEPSENLRDAHILKAEEALEVLQGTKIKDWQLTTAYYAIYHGIYSLLMKIGIKCEIHSCTIEFTKKFLNNHFTEDNYGLIDKAFSARIASQYYVNRKVPKQNYELIMKKAPLFLVKCKNIIIDQNELIKIRTALKVLFKQKKAKK